VRVRVAAGIGTLRPPVDTHLRPLGPHPPVRAYATGRIGSGDCVALSDLVPAPEFHRPDQTGLSSLPVATKVNLPDGTE
jgi:hypothetical protein